MLPFSVHQDHLLGVACMPFSVSFLPLLYVILFFSPRYVAWCHWWVRYSRFVISCHSPRYVYTMFSFPGGLRCSPFQLRVLKRMYQYWPDTYVR